MRRPCANRRPLSPIPPTPRYKISLGPPGGGAASMSVVGGYGNGFNLAALQPPCVDPTGLDIDAQYGRLFVACSGNSSVAGQLYVLSVAAWPPTMVGAPIPIDHDNDGVRWDAARGRVYLTSGTAGNLPVVLRSGTPPSESYRIISVISTQPGAPGSFCSAPASHRSPAFPRLPPTQARARLRSTRLPGTCSPLGRSAPTTRARRRTRMRSACRRVLGCCWCWDAAGLLAASIRQHRALLSPPLQRSTSRTRGSPILLCYTPSGRRAASRGPSEAGADECCCNGASCGSTVPTRQACSRAFSLLSSPGPPLVRQAWARPAAGGGAPPVRKGGRAAQPASCYARLSQKRLLHSSTDVRGARASVQTMPHKST